jgi:hypothetical protein
MEEQFTFELKAKVRIVASGEVGEVIGRVQYAHADDSYFLRYKAGDGRAVESWWNENAIEAAE